MSLSKKIYFSPFGYVISFFQHLMAPFVKRMMVYGYSSLNSMEIYSRNTYIFMPTENRQVKAGL